MIFANRTEKPRSGYIICDEAKFAQRTILSKETCLSMQLLCRTYIRTIHLHDCASFLSAASYKYQNSFRAPAIECSSLAFSRSPSTILISQRIPLRINVNIFAKFIDKNLISRTRHFIKYSVQNFFFFIRFVFIKTVFVETTNCLSAQNLILCIQEQVQKKDKSSRVAIAARDFVLSCAEAARYEVVTRWKQFCQMPVTLCPMLYIRVSKSLLAVLSLSLILSSYPLSDVRRIMFIGFSILEQLQNKSVSDKTCMNRKLFGPNIER